MAEERVDKQWQHKGLAAYSTAAIVGTLKHYGVEVDEASFKEAALHAYPLELASRWKAQWKGTGQFQRFPWMAAEELSRRFFPEQLQPGDYAQALAELMTQLRKLGDGARDAPWQAAFDKVDALRAKVPLLGGTPNERFVTEVRLRLGDWMKIFGSIAQTLAQKGQLDAAERFAGLEEFLFPAWAGVSKAMVRAGKGEKAQALADLAELLKDPKRDGPSKATAVDALIHLDALTQARDAALDLLTQAEQGDDLHLALEMGERAMWLAERLRDQAGLQALLPRLERLQHRHQHEHQH